MPAHHGTSRVIARRSLASSAAVALVLLLSSCSSDGDGGDATAAPSSTASSPSSSTSSPSSPSTSAGAGGPTTPPTEPLTLPPTTLPPTTATPTSTVAPTTTVVVTAPPTTAAPATTAAPPTTVGGSSGTCASGPIAAGATDQVTINGDVDGDQQPDAVTAYALDGVPHVHAQFSAGGESDVEVPIGFADTVTIAFEDIDHSLGADVPPPMVISAVGAGNAGSAVLTFLSPGLDGCLEQWTLDDGPFTFRISQQGPYAGLICDGAAGSIHYTLVTADQRPNGRWRVVSEALTHDGTTAIVSPLDRETVPDDAGLAEQYGNIINCGQPPPIP